MKAPYDNCKYRECDLPGQCRGEGRCHHPASGDRDVPVASEQKLSEYTVARLKLLCRMLGLENAFNDQLYSDPEALFSIFGSMRAALESLGHNNKE